VEDNGDPVQRLNKPVPAVPNLAPMLKGVVDGLAQAKPGKPGGPGRGTAGSGGPGKGGNGNTPNGNGSGTNDLSVKQKRQLRWTMLFTTTDMRDYLRQLQMLGALIGVQYENRQIRMIANLSQRPARLDSSPPPGERIFWLDDKPDSVLAVVNELQLETVPWRVVAYFPESLEKRLLEKELLFGKRFGRDSEEKIESTVFRITFRNGTAQIEVVEQR
jgi:hypothetical protein